MPGTEPARLGSIYEVRKDSIYDTIDSGQSVLGDPNDPKSEYRRLLRMTSLIAQEVIESGDGENFTEGDITKRDRKVKLDGPSGEYDDDGEPISIRQKAHRELVHKLAFEQLKANGYSWKKHKAELDRLRDQPNRWELERRRVARYEAQHGRMTTKRFFQPGHTPEESAAMNDPKNAYRWVDGKWRLVTSEGKLVLPEDINPNYQRVDPLKKTVAPMSTVTTRVTKRPMRSSDLPMIEAQKEKADGTYDPRYRRPITNDVVTDIIDGKISYKNPNLTVDEVEKIFPGLAQGGVVETTEQKSPHSAQAFAAAEDAKQDALTEQFKAAEKERKAEEAKAAEAARKAEAAKKAAEAKKAKSAKKNTKAKQPAKATSSQKKDKASSKKSQQQ